MKSQKKEIWKVEDIEKRTEELVDISIKLFSLKSKTN